ncbi:MAG: hypothetical protein V3U78_10995 [Thiotrichaceae bacterium]
MSFNFSQPFEKVKPPSFIQKINYRIIVAALLSLIALPLIFLTSCTNEENSQKIKSSNQAIQPAEKLLAPQVLSRNKKLPNQSTSYNTSTDFYRTSTVDYYTRNHYFADDRIKLNRKVAAFIKKPPLRSNPKLYNRYHKVRADFYKIRKYRKKLEAMEDKHVGRNHLLSNVEEKRKRYFELEAELFYQLEKMVYFAEQSYMEWEIFKSHDAIQLSRFERKSVFRSQQTANLFEDFSTAVTHYTNASR